MRDEQFAEMLALGHERQGVEFKGAGPRTSNILQGKVIRAILGMANHRDGGLVIIGVDEKNKTLVHTGLTDDQVRSWNQDDLAATLSNYADPAVTFDASVQMYDGKQFVVITVYEFDDIPILCKKNFPHPNDPKYPLLRTGACYVRSRHKPETSEIPTHSEMRDLLDLASQKRLRWFLSQASGAGIQLTGARHPDDSEQFEAQYTGESHPVLERIRSRGYTQVVIRPARFVVDRISPPTRLLPLLQQATVTRFGWNFPQQGPESELEFYQDHISKPNDWNNYIEWWAFYTSAQFVDFRALEADWFEEANHLGQLKERYSAISPGTVLNVYDIVRQFTSTFEFTARLSLDPAFPGDEPIYVTLALHGLQGRELTLLGAPGRSLYRHVTQADDYSYTRVVSREEVSANSTGIALEEASRLFAAFGWEPAAGLLAELQAELTRG